MRRATIDGKRSASWAWNWWDLAIGKLLTKLALNICILHLFIFSQTYRVDTTLPCWTLCGLPWRSRMFFHFPNQIRTSPWIIAMLSSWQPWEVLKVIFFFSFLFQYCIYSIWKWNRTWKERHIDKSFFFTALGLGEKVGNFEIGKDFDALIIDLAQNDGNLEIWPNESNEDRLSKWIHLGDDRSVARVYVHGNEVKEAAKKVLSIKRLVRKRKQSDGDSQNSNGATLN